MRQVAYPRQARVAVTSPEFCNDTLPGISSHYWDQFSAPVIDYYDLLDQLRRDRLGYLSNGLLFIEGWNEDNCVKCFHGREEKL